MKFRIQAGVLLALEVPAIGNAAAIIDNGVIKLGVDEFGQLNVPGGIPSPIAGTEIVGLRDLSTGYEATSHGCLCEGWGVGIADAGGAAIDSGKANNNQGRATNLALVSFTNTASTATSVVSMGPLLITHTFTPAAENTNLYRVSVSIENTGAVDVADLRYTRTFDWDIEPTIFDEYVTIGGADAATNVISAINDGFVDSDPFGVRGSGLVTIVSGDQEDTCVTEAPGCIDDQGANFDFTFGELKAGETREFEIFYGATSSEADAFDALNDVSAEVYSFGQASDNKDGDNGSTFIFGFAGVGGDIVPPSTIPVPAAGLLLLGALGMIGALRARRKAA